MTDTTKLLRSIQTAGTRKMDAQVRDMETTAIESRLKRNRHKGTLGHKVAQAWSGPAIYSGLSGRMRKEWK